MTTLQQTPREIVAELSHEAWERRFLSAKRLANEPGRATFASFPTDVQNKIGALLMQLLDDSTARVRSQAAAALGHLQYRKAAERLMTALADPHEWVRIQVGEALGRVGSRALAPMIARHLESENDSHVRATLVMALGQIGDEKMLPVLALYLDDKDGRVRANAVEAISRLKISRSDLHKTFSRLVNDPNNRVRANIAIGLLESGGENNVQNSGRNSGKNGKKSGSKAGGSAGVKSGGKSCGKTDGKVDEKADEKADGKIAGKNGREILTGMLGSSDEYMRASATYAMGHLRDAADVPMLVKLLEDPSWLVRKNAVRGLVKHGVQTLPEVIAALSSSPDNHVRLGALEVVGQLRDSSARQAVIALLEDDLGEIRNKAEEVLDLLGCF